MGDGSPCWWFTTTRRRYSRRAALTQGSHSCVWYVPPRALGGGIQSQPTSTLQWGYLHPLICQKNKNNECMICILLQMRVFYPTQEVSEKKTKHPGRAIIIGIWTTSLVSVIARRHAFISVMGGTGIPSPWAWNAEGACGRPQWSPRKTTKLAPAEKDKQSPDVREIGRWYDTIWATWSDGDVWVRQMTSRSLDRVQYSLLDKKQWYNSLRLSCNVPVLLRGRSEAIGRLHVSGLTPAWSEQRTKKYATPRAIIRVFVQQPRGVCMRKSSLVHISPKTPALSILQLDVQVVLTLYEATYLLKQWYTINIVELLSTRTPVELKVRTSRVEKPIFTQVRVTCSVRTSYKGSSILWCYNIIIQVY